MNHYLNSKISSVADAILGLTSAMMQLKPPADGQRVQLLKHVHAGFPLVELRVMRDDDKATADYGVRQAWIYTYPDDGSFEMHYTAREDILKLLKEYPHLKNNVTLVSTLNRQGASKFSLQDIYTACEILHSYLTDRTDMVPSVSGNIETNLPQQDA